MARTTSSFARGGPKFREQTLVLVICEDSKSSKEYLGAAAVHFRAHAKVEFAHCGATDPLNIVRAAEKRAKGFDQVFCVIDRDAHDPRNFSEACQVAEQNEKLMLITSHPCFEFWLLLHFGYTRAPYRHAGNSSAADQVIATLIAKPGMANYKKGELKGLFEQLYPRFDDAMKNARRSVQDAEQDSEPNPSTPLYRVMERLIALGEPEIATAVALR